MSALKGVSSWSKGRTKFDHPGLARIAEARRLKNNFANWYKTRIINITYAELNYSEDLAEFYGTVLGDGCVEKYARTEKLTISFNSKEIEHIERVKELIKNLFKKEPTMNIRTYSHCTNLYIYQKHISSRLQFPFGEKLLHPIGIPKWIKKNKSYLIKCLKGLFETDGDWVIDKKYGTNVIKFTSASEGLLADVYESLISLGFFAHRGHRRVTISRAKEVYVFVNLIKFRQYE